ncbi:winged helix-turn-helix transcriptional regulator [Haloparvum sp. AD34]
MAGRKETISDEEILSIFIENSDPFLTTSELADELDFTLTGIRKRLYDLDEEGYLSFKKAGNSPVWWITDEGKEFIESERD